MYSDWRRARATIVSVGFSPPLLVNWLPAWVAELFGWAEGQGYDRERGVCAAAAGELAAVGDEEIFHVVRLAVFVDDAVALIFGHAIRSHIVRGRKRLVVHGPFGADGFVEGVGLLEPVLLHGEVVRVIVYVDVRNRHAVLVLAIRMERDAIVFAGHVLADDPDSREIHIVVDPGSAIASPFAGTKVGGEAG